jgi:hypothetical protein
MNQDSSTPTQLRLDDQMPVSNHHHGAVMMLLIAVMLSTFLAPYVHAQPSGHIPATLAALEAFPSFFHRLEVVVRAKAEGDLEEVFVTDGERRIRVLNVVPPLDADPELLEIEGTYWDVGRLRPDDPRLVDYSIPQLSERVLGKPWPSSGELKLLIANSARPANEPDTVTIRAISLEPDRYRDQSVTLTGRFRGRNLYGDLPEAPGITRDDFVLQSGGAAVWIVGMEPRGQGFHLDVMARVDTSRWLKITGIVSGRDRLVEINAEKIEAIERPAVTEIPVANSRPEQGPKPEVIFSTPTPDDSGVATSELVRFQFSRDMDAASFSGNIEALYVGVATETSLDQRSLELTVEYRPRNRVLNVEFAEPLLPYRPVAVSLGPGILATDGAPLVPYTLQFATGGP